MTRPAFAPRMPVLTHAHAVGHFAVALLLALLLSTTQPLAHAADIYGYIDEKGVAHFASEKLDERYQLFFRGGQSFDTANGIGPLWRGRKGAIDGKVPRASQTLLALFEASPSYKLAQGRAARGSPTHDIDYELLQALIATESGFDAQAVSPKGALGLMQLMPATAQRYGVQADKRGYAREEAVRPAHQHRHRFALPARPDRRCSRADIELALAAYNAGEGAVQRAGNKIPNYRETQNYVKTVLQLYAYLKPSAAAGRGGKSPGRMRMELAPPRGGAIGRGNMPPDSRPMPAMPDPDRAAGKRLRLASAPCPEARPMQRRNLVLATALAAVTGAARAQAPCCRWRRRSAEPYAQAARRRAAPPDARAGGAALHREPGAGRRSRAAGCRARPCRSRAARWPGRRPRRAACTSSAATAKARSTATTTTSTTRPPIAGSTARRCRAAPTTSPWPPTAAASMRFGGFVEQNRRSDTNAYVYEIAARPLDARSRRCRARAARRRRWCSTARIHLIGGASEPAAERASVGWHEVYDPQADRWTARKPLPGARDHVGCVAHNGQHPRDRRALQHLRIQHRPAPRLPAGARHLGAARRRCRPRARATAWWSTAAASTPWAARAASWSAACRARPRSSARWKATIRRPTAGSATRRCRRRATRSARP